MKSSDVEDAAAWMNDEVRRSKSLYQSDAVARLRKTSKSLVLENDDGGFSIVPSVLRAFRRLTGDEVVWVRGEQMWRLRVRSDGKGRQQDG
jgi:hypothetical protein